MTPEAMRIAIAESEQWRIEHSTGTLWRLLYGTCLMTTFTWSDFKGKLEPPTLKDVQSNLPNYPEDLNAILPLLPKGIGVEIRPKLSMWIIECWSDGSLTLTSNESLALAACEFYLKWKGLWKE